jgi:hypothetical protein
MSSKSFMAISLVLVMLILSGCESTSVTRSSYMRTLMGKHIDRVIYVEGAPSAKIERSTGGYVYTWKTFGQVQCNENYVTNEDGIIVSWSYSGCSEYVRLVK